MNCKMVGLMLLLILGSCAKPSIEEELALQPEVLEPEIPEVVFPEEFTFRIEIDSSMTGDLTEYIQAKIDSIPDGTATQAHLIQLPEGRIWTEGGDVNYATPGSKGIINIVNRHNLIIRGYSKENPTVFYTKAPASPFGGNVDQNNFSRRRHFNIKESTNIVVQNIRIEGSNKIEGVEIGTTAENTPDFWLGGPDESVAEGFPAYRPYWELEHAFNIINSQNITIENSEVFGVWGDGVYIGQSVTNPSDNITLRNMHIRFVGRQGVGVSDARNILIDNIWVDKGRRSGIDLEPFHSDGFATDVEVRNSTIDVHLTAFAAGGRGDVSNVNIHNNEFSSGAYTLFCRSSDNSNPTVRSNWRFANNIRLNRAGSTAPPVKFGWVENIVIEGNYDNFSSDFAVGLNTCKNVQVLNNSYSGGNIIRLTNTLASEVTHSGNSPSLIVQ